MKKLTLLIVIFALIGVDLAEAQSVTSQKLSYKLLESDVDKYVGFIGGGGGMFLGGATILGISLEVRGQYDIPGLPLTAWFQGHRELVGVGHIDRGPLEYKAKPMELNGGVMLPIIPGKKKKDDVKIILESAGSYSSSYISSYEKSFRPRGEVKTDLLAKVGLYSFSSSDASNAGLTLGITRRKREHAKVEVGDYIYDTHYDKQFYLDLIYTPITNLPEPGTDANGQVVPLDPATSFGARIGFQKLFYGTRSINYELSLRPYSDAYLFTLAVRYTFGIGL
ncbi:MULTISPECIES: hypothetical protein [Roseivirga]|uniref:Uncharacterized protein n=1 Tax=Roseivirga spongicola TaxID=333140 RepID=A0A150X966_9BACT|nr:MULTISPECIES: hypothetical protein [Roseivirga]KYG75224.1 hypothetical protein AWW68_10480 [Roseivirga spongicola]MBO6661985.1 hypothetical protein [Roseivirga sp.]MBO6761461.1 hypothetical protein [Roseivirga sp.]MBO6909426.1 hypothetical protein [Roseivirga sp.]WPZ08583.1 hypothetical protein T7867_09945 [Roseivirga spongicola]